MWSQLHCPLVDVEFSPVLSPTHIWTSHLCCVGCDIGVQCPFSFSFAVYMQIARFQARICQLCFQTSSFLSQWLFSIFLFFVFFLLFFFLGTLVSNCMRNNVIEDKKLFLKINWKMWNIERVSSWEVSEPWKFHVCFDLAEMLFTAVYHFDLCFFLLVIILIAN